MNKLYSFSIPDLPPSLNAVYKIGRGQLYKDPDVAVFYKIANYLLPKVKDTINTPVGLSLTFTFSDNVKLKMSDINAFAEISLSMLENFWIIKNKNQIVDLSLKKILGEKDKIDGFLYDCLYLVKRF